MADNPMKTRLDPVLKQIQEMVDANRIHQMVIVMDLEQGPVVVDILGCLDRDHFMEFIETTRMMLAQMKATHQAQMTKPPGAPTH